MVLEEQAERHARRIAELEQADDREHEDHGADGAEADLDALLADEAGDAEEEQGDGDDDREDVKVAAEGVLLLRLVELCLRLGVDCLGVVVQGRLPVWVVLGKRRVVAGGIGLLGPPVDGGG